VGHESRRDDRYNVAVAASFQNGTGASNPVRVTNISATGCRFSAPGKLPTGSLITMSFGRLGQRHAKVRWRVGTGHGVRFDEPLLPAALDHIRLFLSEQPAFVAEREPMTAG
jgi:hypothetical protein